MYIKLAYPCIHVSLDWCAVDGCDGVGTRIRLFLSELAVAVCVQPF